VITGDLLWNGFFPNYVDARPGALTHSIRALVRQRQTVYVPGHGPLASASAMSRYLLLLDSVEDAARRAHERGLPPAEAAKTFALPASLGEWYTFSPGYYEVALEAWERELSAGRGQESSGAAVSKAAPGPR